ncbi:MAG: hypothetical protein AABX51_08845 [Nanoarchaeota archaeon]
MDKKIIIVSGVVGFILILFMILYFLNNIDSLAVKFKPGIPPVNRCSLSSGFCAKSCQNIENDGIVRNHAIIFNITDPVKQCANAKVIGGTDFCCSKVGVEIT